MKVGNIIAQLSKDRKLFRLSKKNRLIPQRLYHKLKKIRNCQQCDMKMKGKERLQIHHKVPICEGGKNNEKNLISICKDCHRKIHEGK